MPPHVSADPAAQQPPSGSVEALIHRTRRLRTELDAVRRDNLADTRDDHDPHGRWQRTLYDLAADQLDELGRHLGRIREGGPDTAPDGGDPTRPRGEDHDVTDTAGAPAATDGATRAGTAEWDLLTDEVHWSEELYAIFGRSPSVGPLPLDELGSVLLEDDQPVLTAMMTDCLIDGKPIDGEFRIRRPDGAVRTVHLRGEPLLDPDGCTASMWAVVRDTSELRRSREAVRASGEHLLRRRRADRTAHRVAAELRETVRPAWHGPLRLSDTGSATGTLDVAAHRLPTAPGVPDGGDWYDALALPDGGSLLTVGELTGQGVTAASGTAMVLGALRGMALAGITPGPLLGWLDHLLADSAGPALGSALCCRYAPATGTLLWARAGHPAPVLYRDGGARLLEAPAGALPGVPGDAVYEQAEARLRPGDLLVLHTDGLAPRRSPADTTGRLLALAPRLTGTLSAREALRTLVTEFDGAPREDDACLLVARVDG